MRNSLDLGAVRILTAVMASVDPDLVHLHTGRATWLGGRAARRAGYPAITTRRQDKRVKRGWKSRRMYGTYVRRVVAISPAVADRLAEGGVDRACIDWISSAVDPASVRPEQGRERTRLALGADIGTIVILSAGSLVHRKGIDVLLEALAKVRVQRTWELWLAGDGGERERLEMLADRLGLADSVRFLGRRTDTGDLLAACDLYVQPSRAEGLGIAALEAMAAARPVLASRVGGLRHSVTEGRVGLLVSPEDPAALAEALTRLIPDEELRQRLGDNGPARIREGFLPGKMVDDYEALYLEVLVPEVAP
jgi:glycosyltransferase involved in cell wall biosynthesis